MSTQTLEEYIVTHLIQHDKLIIDVSTQNITTLQINVVMFTGSFLIYFWL